MTSIDPEEVLRRARAFNAGIRPVPPLKINPVRWQACMGRDGFVRFRSNVCGGEHEVGFIPGELAAELFDTEDLDRLAMSQGRWLDMPAPVFCLYEREPVDDDPELSARQAEGERQFERMTGR